MSDTIRTVALVVAAGALLLVGVASFLVSSNGRWVAASGAAVLDTRTGRICAMDAKGVGFCDDYGTFKVSR